MPQHVSVQLTSTISGQQRTDLSWMVQKYYQGLRLYNFQQLNSVDDMLVSGKSL